MAFVQGYQHDVFISYACVDDASIIPNDEETRWVSALVRTLTIRIDQRLGRSGSVDIWMDRKGLQGNSELSPEIEAAVRNSAVILCVASEGYLASNWCQLERELFIEACGGNTERRIIVVRRDDIPHTDPRWPEPFRRVTGYPFFFTDPVTGVVVSYASPKPDPQEKGYYVQVERLRSDIAQQLKSMKEKDRGERPSRSPPGTDGVNGGSLPAAPVAFRVYLGEVTPDMFEARERIKRHLEQIGVEVRPSSLHSRVPEEFRRGAEQEMAGCRYCIQLLGRFGFQAMPGLPNGYEGIEREVAESAQVPLLRWRDRELRPDSVHDAAHRELVNAPDVIAMTIEELKSFLAERIRVTRAGDCVQSKSEEEAYVLLRADSNDLRLADQVANKLLHHEIGYDIIDDDTALKDVTESDDYDGLIVLYGGCSQEWVQGCVRECRRVALRKKQNAPVCAVYVGPPEPKDPLRTRPPRFHIIDKDHEKRLEEFIGQITRSRE
jgi:hypothetical protein